VNWLYNITFYPASTFCAATSLKAAPPITLLIEEKTNSAIYTFCQQLLGYPAFQVQAF
jgi:hypothetical protein